MAVMASSQRLVHPGPIGGRPADRMIQSGARGMVREIKLLDRRRVVI